MLKRKLKYFKVLVIIFILTISFFSIIPFVFTDGENWLTDWNYRKSHILKYASDSGVNYQIKMIVDYGSGSDSDNTVYLNGKCKTDFGDIRFTDNDGNTKLNYWIEKKIDSDNAVFWVEITDDLSSVNVVIYIYYGNNIVSTTSSGVNTFIYFDHFNDESINGDWNTQGTPVESGTEIVLNDDDALYSTTTFGVGGVAVMARAKANEQDIEFVAFKSDFGVGGRALDYANIINSDIDFPDDFDRFRCDTNDGADIYGEVTQVDNQLDFRNTYHIYEVAWNASQIKFYQDGNLFATHTDPLPDIALGVGWRVWDSSQESVLTVDWVVVRKFVEPEPIHGAWGGEEEEEADSVPFYSDAGYDGKTQVGLNADFWVFWEDDFALETCYFSTNNTGSWVNSSISVSGVSSWANITLPYLNYTSNIQVEYMWYCSDNASQWNWTSTYSLITTSLYITFNFNNSTMGKFYVNYVNTANETQNSYNYNESILLDGIQLSSDYSFLNFTWTSGNSLINNYEYYTSGNNTIWCYFGLSGVGGIDESYFVLGFVIAGCAILFMVIVLKSDKKEK